MEDKKNRYLICVDSDGCVMDTMNEKHSNCFGPELVRVYQLEHERKKVLEYWNTVNLYSETRGINRFLALAAVLQRLRTEDIYQSDLGLLEEWIKQAGSLSNNNLKQAWEQTGAGCLKQALEWSEAVNRSIRRLGHGRGPFTGVDEALHKIAGQADIAVVSSANQEALQAEWQNFGLDRYVTRIMSQNDGSKADCIRELIASGYQPEHLLMVGDAPGDLKAARQNGVCFYPILIGREEECWNELPEKAVLLLQQGNFTAAYQRQLIDCFYRQLQKGQKQS